MTLDPRQPLTLPEMAKLLVQCFGWPPDEVTRRLKLEERLSGYNVVHDFVAHQLEPFEWSAALERFYESTDAFVFELMLYNAHPSRVQLRSNILAALAAEGRRRKDTPRRLLFWGDGLGFDSAAALLTNSRDEVVYFDVSRLSSEFAASLFERSGARGVRVMTSFEEVTSERYDAIAAIDVLEHLPDPRAWIETARSLLKPGGVAIIKEAFDAVIPARPTHLRSNLRFVYRTPELFEEAGFNCERFGNFPYVFRAGVPVRRWSRDRWYHKLTAPIKRARLAPRMNQKPDLQGFLRSAGPDR